MIYKYCQIKYAFPNASNMAKYIAWIKCPSTPSYNNSLCTLLLGQFKFISDCAIHNPCGPGELLDLSRSFSFFLSVKCKQQ